jgi:hypothetical protein
MDRALMAQGFPFRKNVWVKSRDSENKLAPFAACLPIVNEYGLGAEL